MEDKEELKFKELIFKEFNVKKDVSRFMLDICRRFKLFGKNFGKKDLFMKLLMLNWLFLDSIE